MICSRRWHIHDDCNAMKAAVVAMRYAALDSTGNVSASVSADENSTTAASAAAAGSAGDNSIDIGIEMCLR